MADTRNTRRRRNPHAGARHVDTARKALPEGFLPVATDGSALGNPGPAGWGWWVSEQVHASGALGKSTNNVGELAAIRDALGSLPEDVDVVILTDSQYAINCLDKWMAGWVRRGWCKADGSPVGNVDLLRDIDLLRRERSGRVELWWVRGHSGHRLNEAADRLANRAAHTQKGVRPGWTVGMLPEP